MSGATEGWRPLEDGVGFYRSSTNAGVVRESGEAVLIDPDDAAIVDGLAFEVVPTPGHTEHARCGTPTACSDTAATGTTTTGSSGTGNATWTAWRGSRTPT